MGSCCLQQQYKIRYVPLRQRVATQQADLLTLVPALQKRARTSSDESASSASPSTSPDAARHTRRLRERAAALPAQRPSADADGTSAPSSWSPPKVRAVTAVCPVAAHALYKCTSACGQRGGAHCAALASTSAWSGAQVKVGCLDNTAPASRQYSRSTCPGVLSRSRAPHFARVHHLHAAELRSRVSACPCVRMYPASAALLLLDPCACAVQAPTAHVQAATHRGGQDRSARSWPLPDPTTHSLADVYAGDGHARRAHPQTSSDSAQAAPHNLQPDSGAVPERSAAHVTVDMMQLTTGVQLERPHAARPNPFLQAFSPQDAHVQPERQLSARSDWPRTFERPSPFLPGRPAQGLDPQGLGPTPEAPSLPGAPLRSVREGRSGVPGRALNSSSSRRHVWRQVDRQTAALLAPGALIAFQTGTEEWVHAEVEPVRTCAPTREFRVSHMAIRIGDLQVARPAAQTPT